MFKRGADTTLFRTAYDWEETPGRGEEGGDGGAQTHAARSIAVTAATAVHRAFLNKTKKRDEHGLTHRNYKTPNYNDASLSLPQRVSCNTHMATATLSIRQATHVRELPNAWQVQKTTNDTTQHTRGGQSRMRRSTPFWVAYPTKKGGKS